MNVVNSYYHQLLCDFSFTIFFVEGFFLFKIWRFELFSHCELKLMANKRTFERKFQIFQNTEKRKTLKNIFQRIMEDFHHFTTFSTLCWLVKLLFLSHFAFLNLPRLLALYRYALLIAFLQVKVRFVVSLFIEDETGFSSSLVATS